MTTQTDEAMAVLDEIQREFFYLQNRTDFSGQDRDRWDAIARELKKSNAHLLAKLTAADRLAEAAEIAANKLHSMAVEFGRTNFTDRYGDGPNMQARSDLVKAALADFWGVK